MTSYTTAQPVGNYLHRNMNYRTSWQCANNQTTMVFYSAHSLQIISCGTASYPQEPLPTSWKIHIFPYSNCCLHHMQYDWQLLTNACLTTLYFEWWYVSVIVWEEEEFTVHVSLSWTERLIAFLLCFFLTQNTIAGNSDKSCVQINQHCVWTHRSTVSQPINENRS